MCVCVYGDVCVRDVDLWGGTRLMMCDLCTLYCVCMTQFKWMQSGSSS